MITAAVSLKISPGSPAPLADHFAAITRQRGRRVSGRSLCNTVAGGSRQVNCVLLMCNQVFEIGYHHPGRNDAKQRPSLDDYRLPRLVICSAAQLPSNDCSHNIHVAQLLVP